MRNLEIILSTIYTFSNLVPRVSDTNLGYGSYPMHDVVSTFPTSLLLVTLSLKLNHEISQKLI